MFESFMLTQFNLRIDTQVGSDQIYVIIRVLIPRFNMFARISIIVGNGNVNARS